MPETNQTPGTGPYADHATAYLTAGWAPLPLPRGQKKHPPSGWTGAGGAWPSGADVYAWTEEHADGNIALRLPPNVIGVDVDSYDAKPGGLVLADLEQRLGELPSTWRSTSRDDGVSGIRFYTVPEGLRWPSVLGPGIETIRHGHRYAVAWPSVHPNGGTYRWVTPDGATALTEIPTPDDLPELPDAWVAHFTGGEMAHTQDRAGLDDTQVDGWLQVRTGTMCRRTEAILKDTLDGMLGAGSRHDHMLTATNRLVWVAGMGHTGVPAALEQARKAFLTATAGDRTPGEAQAEWDRMVAGAVDLAAAAHPDTPPVDPCTDPFAGIVKPTRKDATSCAPTATAPTSNGSTPSPGPTTTNSSSPASGAATSPTPPSTTPDPEPQQPDEGEASREVRTRLRDGASFILDIPDHVPAIWGDGEHVLWASGEALTLAGPAGVGKTTLTGQVVRARLVGGEVLGLNVTPTESKILYLAMDRPRQIARALRRTLGDLPREVLADKLVVWPGPPIADVAAHPETLVGLVHLAGADTVIIDSIKDAAVGLSSDEVGAGYNRARQMCIAAGIEVLEQHHMVKKGEGGNAPTSLADLYGSVWIGAGSGSVVLLHGAAGDPIVSMTHLKTPAEEVGPWRLRHDHDAGVTEIFHSTDLVVMAKLSGRKGITAKQAAAAIAEKENPSTAMVEKARRRLDALASQGKLARQDGARGGAEGGRPATWVWVSDETTADHGPVDNLWKSDHESDHGRDRAETDHAITERSRSAQNRRSSDHGSDHGDHGQTDHVPAPLFIRGRDGRRVAERVIGGERVVVDLDSGEIVEEDQD